MKKYLKPLCFVTALSLLIPMGCGYNRSSPDLLVDNQQITTTGNPETGRHDCDTLVFTCIDYRFANANQEFINETLGLRDNYDHISIPGSIKNLVNPETRDVLIGKFELSVKLHLINRVVIISHKDCGGYGGSATFGSEIAENETLATDLRKARALLIDKYPTLEINLYLESLVHEGDGVKVHFEKIL